MSSLSNRKIKDHIENIVYKNGNQADYDALLRCGRDVLPVLAQYLTRDLPIAELEKAEQILKVILGYLLKEKITGGFARDLARFQMEVGFLFKYKSYAVKAVSPLGYAIFTQQPGEGFSFQRHITHKTEIFHILEVQPGGYVFICDYEEWGRVYEKEAFARWLEGNPDPRFDRFRIVPEPGDIFVIDQLNVVHTVMGCMLEEFATVSTDMVDRLHDQNAGNPIPSFYNRDYAGKVTREISHPASNRLISLAPGNGSASAINPVKIPGGSVTRLASRPVDACRFRVDRGSATQCQRDERCAVSIYVAAGKGNLITGDDVEVNQTTPPVIPVCHGDLVMVPAGIYYGFVNEGPGVLEITQHKIPIDTAFKY